MDNLRNAVLGEVDGQIRIFWNFKIFVHPREAIDDALLRLSVHTTPISFPTILDRGRYVYEEEIAARSCLMRDRLTNGLPSCIVRSNRCRDHRCTRARELSRNKPYPLQVFVALFPRKGMACVKSEPRRIRQEIRLPGSLLWRVKSPSNRDVLRPPCSLTTV